MAEFLTTKGTSHQIEDVIIDARSWLVLISPYLQLSDSLSKRLIDAESRGVKIVLVYGKDQLKPAEMQKLRQLSHLSLFFLKNMHAKCYFNEEQAVLASMNMYEYSELNNREMGILIKKADEPRVFVDIVKEAVSFICDAKSESSNKEILESLNNLIKETSSKIEVKSSPVSTEKKSSSGEESKIITKKTPTIVREVRTVVEEPNVIRERQPAYLSEVVGYCIRCRKRIHQNPDYPLCDDCYKEWAKFQNPVYPEHFCHVCGREIETSYLKPLCNSCYRNS